MLNADFPTVTNHDLFPDSLLESGARYRIYVQVENSAFLARAEIDAMVRAAQKHINRKVGQSLRRIHEGLRK